jgi:hypothetical protein
LKGKFVHQDYIRKHQPPENARPLKGICPVQSIDHFAKRTGIATDGLDSAAFTHIVGRKIMVSPAGCQI